MKHTSDTPTKLFESLKRVFEDIVKSEPYMSINTTELYTVDNVTTELCTISFVINSIDGLDGLIDKMRSEAFDEFNYSYETHGIEAKIFQNKEIMYYKVTIGFKTTYYSKNRTF